MKNTRVIDALGVDEEDGREREADAGGIDEEQRRAVPADRLLMRKLMKNTSASGAKHEHPHQRALFSSAGPSESMTSSQATTPVSATPMAM